MTDEKQSPIEVLGQDEVPQDTPEDVTEGLEDEVIDLEQVDSDEEDEEVTESDDDQEAQDIEQEPEVDPLKEVVNLRKNEDLQWEALQLEEEKELLALEYEQAVNATPEFLHRINLSPYRFNGKEKNVYAMSDDEFDSLMDNVEDYLEEQGHSKGEIRKVVRGVTNSRHQFKTHLERETARLNALHNQLDGQQWEIIIQNGPKLLKDKDAQHKIAEWIKDQQVKNPAISKMASTFKGKLQILERALKGLNLKTVEKVEEPKSRPVPTVHKGAVKGKSVAKKSTPKVTSEAIKNMSNEEYLKLRKKLGF